jgi:hypothetical protein
MSSSFISFYANGVKNWVEKPEDNADGGLCRWESKVLSWLAGEQWRNY